MNAPASLLRMTTRVGFSAIGAIALLAVAAGFAADPPSSVASAADLAAVAEDMVKSLETTVATEQAFKAAVEKVEHEAYVIALVANTVTEAEGDAKWKANASAVRDAALELAKAKSQAAADKAFKQLQAQLGGGAGGAGKAMKPFEVTSLHHMMKEVGNRNRTMRKNLRSLARSKDTVVRDAQLWALVAAVARTDTKAAKEAKKPQADFEKFADAFLVNAKSLADAAKKGDSKAANDALKAASKACSDCHTDFRPDIVDE